MTMTTAFQVGDEIELECRSMGSEDLVDASSAVTDAKSVADSAAEDWSGRLLCLELGEKPLSFGFGQDVFAMCSLQIKDEATYNFIQGVVAQEIAWQCRVPMSKDKQFYIPVTIPLWGVVEPSHTHINLHLNFVFHADNGRIMAAAVYSVRDRFQFTSVGTVLNLHGPVRWFHRHSFESLAVAHSPSAIAAAKAAAAAAAAAAAGAGPNGVPAGVPSLASPAIGSRSCTVQVLGWTFFSVLATIVLCTLFYALRLRPALIKKYLKHD